MTILHGLILRYYNTLAIAIATKYILWLVYVTTATASHYSARLELGNHAETMQESEYNYSGVCDVAISTGSAYELPIT